jgi:hypothetical protein
MAWLSGLMVSRGMSHVSVMILTTVSNVDAIGKPLIANAFGESAQESAKIERHAPAGAVSHAP